jgi:hypothetical protein
MACYRVSFFKDLVSSDGHPFKCIQKIIEIRHARSPERAVKCAQLRYERLDRVHDWTLHSDCLGLEIDGKKVDYCPTELVASKMPVFGKAAQTKPCFEVSAKSAKVKVKVGATIADKLRPHAVIAKPQRI